MQEPCERPLPCRQDQLDVLPLDPGARALRDATRRDHLHHGVGITRHGATEKSLPESLKWPNCSRKRSISSRKYLGCGGVAVALDCRPLGAAQHFDMFGQPIEVKIRVEVVSIDMPVVRSTSARSMPYARPDPQHGV